MFKIIILNSKYNISIILVRFLLVHKLEFKVISYTNEILELAIALN